MTRPAAPKSRSLPDIELPIRMPFVEPPSGLSQAEHEAFRNRALLAANGFGEGRADWRRATDHMASIIRFAALHLLVQAPEAADRQAFEACLDDENALARVSAAAGLAHLGDARGRAALIQALDPIGDDAAPAFAAAHLAALGDPRGFDVVIRQLGRSDTPHVALSRLEPFVAHQGAPLANGARLDVWPYYRAALLGPDVEQQGVAIRHLAAIASPAAIALLETYVARTPVPPLQVQARAALDAL